MAQKRGLGKGLDSLIPSSVLKPVTPENITDASATVSKEEKPVETIVKITKIEPNREQPRKHFDEESLKELADSIKQYGLISPILVQERKEYYEIIAGERRWRAAKIAGLKEVPVIIRDYTDREIAEIALIENVQREDLNPIEEAMGYKRLIEEFDLKQEEVAECVSKSRSAITNSMRLLKLPEQVQKYLIDSQISMGHARALLTVENTEKQVELAEKVIKENLSVREVEKLVKNLDKIPKEKPEPDAQLQAIYASYEEKMKQALSTKVSISQSLKKKGAGKFEIEFYSTEDFERIVEKLMRDENTVTY